MKNGSWLPLFQISVSWSLSRIRVRTIYMFDSQIGIQQSRALIATINQSAYTNIDIFNSRSVSCYYNRYIGNLYHGVDHLSLCSKHLFKTVFTPSLFWSGESENCFSRSVIISIGNTFPKLKSVSPLLLPTSESHNVYAE